MPHFDRAVMMYCCRDGTISFGPKGKPTFNKAALPVFSVDTEEEAEALQVLTCARQAEDHPNPNLPSPWYRLASGPFPYGFSGKLKDLEVVTEYFKELYEERIRR